jgi:hypothetical protein
MKKLLPIDLYNNTPEASAALDRCIDNSTEYMIYSIKCSESGNIPLSQKDFLIQKKLTDANH